MGIQLIGGSLSDAPFNRTFFNTTLGELLDKAGKDQSHRLTLFLSDGTQLDVCQIEKMAEDYLSLRAYQGGNDSCEMSVHLVPYVLIYRIEIAPKAPENGQRVGFHWSAPPKKGQTSRRTR
jgi:hypothetical protein